MQIYGTFALKFQTSPNNHRIIPSHGFSFYLNNSDLIHIIDDVGKDHVMGLFQSVKREYPTIQGNEQLLKNNKNGKTN